MATRVVDRNTGRWDRSTTLASVTNAPISRSVAPVARLAYLDNLKVALVVAVIVVHAANFYYGTSRWPGDATTTLSYVAIVTVMMAFGIGNMFAMGTFFFMAAWLTPRSLARKGTWRFLWDRLLRLGVPLAFSVLLIFPGAMFAGTLGTTGDVGQAWKASADSLGRLDPGPAWFLTELLLFSALFAAYRWWRPMPLRAPEPLRARNLLIAIGLIAAVTFPWHLVWPMTSGQPLGLHLFLWPQCLTLFWLGALAAERGWLDDISRRIRRFLVGAVAVAALMVPLGWIVSGATTDFSPFIGGWHWQALGAGIIEGVLAVCVSVLLVDWFHRRVNRQGRLGRNLSSGAYGAFILQVPVLVAGALLLRPVPLTGDLKFVVLALIAIVGAFAVANVLKRVALIRRFV